MLRNRFLIRAFEAIESFAYRHARFITVHSEGNQAYLINKGIPSDRVRVVHNWADTASHHPERNGRSFREQYSLDGQFTLLFAGVMGYAQDLDTVIECAHLLKDHEGILFLLVGDGVEKPALVRKVERLGLTNVRFADFVGKDDYPDLVVASQVGLVTLKKTMTPPIVPSKILGYMACGRPFIASLNPESDAHTIIREGQCGIAVPPGDPSAMAEAILTLYQRPDLLETMGQNGRTYVERHFSKEVCLSHYESLFKEAISIKYEP